MSSPRSPGEPCVLAVYKPKELVLVLDCVHPLVFRVKALAALAVLMAGCGALGAQNAPTLLPYTSKLIAGGGTQNYAAGVSCPSGLVSTDAYSDGCLATEILLATTSTSGSGPRYAIADKTGAVFFSDGTNGLVRRVDPSTGVVTVVAGGAASSPASGVTCGGLKSTDSDGDGCLGTAVKLSHPAGLAFDATGNLYFSDVGYDNIREIAATNGVITTTGVITNVAGGSTYGYNVNNTAATGQVIAATQSYLDFPYGIAFDKLGNLYVSDEGNEAIEVINLTGASETLQGVTIPAGTIEKIMGYGSYSAKTLTADCPDFVSTSSRGGCYFGAWTDGSKAISSPNDGPYAVATDTSGNVYFANEFNDNVGQISSGNVIVNYAGKQTSVAKQANTQRGTAGTFSIGSPFGVATDSLGDLYVTDATSGLVWRVDAVTKAMYVIAGGASSTCTGAADTNGDGCPALQAKFGSNPSASTYASTTLPGPGIFGITADANSNVYVGDTETALIREVASGTQFGQVGSAVTQTLEVHFAVGDSPAASAYTLTSGAANFTLGTATCTANSDNTMDCLLPVTAVASTSATLGTFTGTLQVTSALGGVNTFALSGTHVQTPVTRITVAAAANSSCSGTTVYSPTTSFTFTATITSTGSPAGTVQFYANSIAIGSPVQVSASTATLSYTFSTPGTYAVSAAYSGDTYFSSSKTVVSAPVTTATPSIGMTLVEAPVSGSVVQGATATYGFTLAQTVYTGTVTFSVSGLPANSTAVFSPASTTGTGCTVSNTITLNVQTQLFPVKQSGLGGGGPWRLGLTLIAILLAIPLAWKRRTLNGPWRRMSLLLALLVASTGLLACGKGTQGAPSTPAGSYPLTVTATGSTGAVSSLTTTLVVTAYQDPYR